MGADHMEVMLHVAMDACKSHDIILRALPMCFCHWPSPSLSLLDYLMMSLVVPQPSRKTLQCMLGPLLLTYHMKVMRQTPLSHDLLLFLESSFSPILHRPTTSTLSYVSTYVHCTCSHSYLWVFPCQHLSQWAVNTAPPIVQCGNPGGWPVHLQTSIYPGGVK